MASSGILALDALTGGLPRGCITEIYGPASSGRTSVLLSALSAATCRGEFCVIVDASDALDPQSLASSRIDLEKLLWIRCGEHAPQRHRITERNHQQRKAESPAPRARGQQFSEQRLEQLLRSADMLLESGGFGLIVLDLADLPVPAARHIPLTTWFRFRRAIEHKPTVLLVIEQQPIAGSCSSLLLKTAAAHAGADALVRPAPNESMQSQVRTEQTGSRAAEKEYESPRDGIPVPAHAELLTGLNITAELIRSRIAPAEVCSSEIVSHSKPAASVSAAFHSTTEWEKCRTQKLSS